MCMGAAMHFLARRAVEISLVPLLGELELLHGCVLHTSIVAHYAFASTGYSCSFSLALLQPKQSLHTRRAYFVV